MKNRLFMLCAALLTCLMISCLTSSGDGDENTGTSLINYKITESDLSGWTLTNTDVYPTVQELADAINGDVIRFDSYTGMTESMTQRLEKSSDQTINAIMVYYTVEKSAADMLKDRETSNTGSTLALPGYDNNTAFYVTGIGTITVYAKLKQCYIELLIGGIDDETTAKQVAVQVLGVYESKIQ